MSRAINFVRDRQRNLSRLEVQDRKFFRWALMGAGILAGIAVLVVGARLYLLYSLRNVTATQKGLTTAISNKIEVEKSYTLFSYKLKTLTELFGKRKEKQETIEYFSNLFTTDVIVSQLAYSSESEELSFTLQAKNVFVMENVFKVLNGQEVKTKYPTMKKSNLSRSQNGDYSMDLSIALSEKPLEKIQAEAATQATNAQDDTLNQPASGGGLGI